MQPTCLFVCALSLCRGFADERPDERTTKTVGGKLGPHLDMGQITTLLDFHIGLIYHDVNPGTPQVSQWGAQMQPPYETIEVNAPRPRSTERVRLSTLSEAFASSTVREMEAVCRGEGDQGGSKAVQRCWKKRRRNACTLSC